MNQSSTDVQSIPRALTIAGSDPTSGAGIQADLKTFAAHRVYGLSVITAITAQNTHEVQEIYPVSLEALRKQCESLVADIPIKFIKTGMIYDAAAIEFVANFIKDHQLVAVVDTPFAASDGMPLINSDAIKIFSEKLLPAAEIITPNIFEAEALTGLKIESKEDMERAAHILIELGAKTVLIKGGHLSGDDSSDLLVIGDESEWFSIKRIVAQNTHGTGCALSAAIAANLALGKNLHDAVFSAKEYITEAIRHSISLGSGDRLPEHFYETLPK